jgi:hypothetical protein
LRKFFSRDGTGKTRHKFEHSYHLFPCHVEPLHDFFYACPGFEVLKTVETGIRVSLNTQAPLRLPGMLSTAGHCDQSRLDQEITKRTGTLRFQWRQRGHTLSLADATIAAVALHHNLALLTDNRKRSGL